MLDARWQKGDPVREFTQLEMMLALRVLVRKGIVTQQEIDDEHGRYIEETRAVWDNGLG